MHAPREHAGAPYAGPAGSSIVYFVAEADEDHRPVRRLSGTLLTHEIALEVARWARRRSPRARIFRQRLLLDVVEG